MADTFGKWFLEFEKHNEDCDILCGIYDEAKNLELRQYPHSHYDGYSVALAYLEERGKHDRVRQFLEATGGELPSLPQLVRLILTLTGKLIFRPRPRRMRMRASGWPTQPVRLDRQRIAWRILDHDDSDRINRQASLAGTTVNAWMIAGAIPALAPLWAETGNRICCGVSISLHRYIKFDRQPMNRFGIINLLVDESGTPASINRQIRDNLRQRMHLANWVSYYLPDYLGRWYYRMTLPLVGFFQERNLMFTNLGETGGGTGHSVFMIPPVMHYNPVSLGVLTWEGRTAITLQFHPHLDVGPDAPEDIIDEWIHSITGGCVPVPWATSRGIREITARRMQAAV